MTRVTGRIHQGTYLGDMIEYQIDTELAGALVVRRQNVRAAAGPGPSARARR